MNFAAATAYCSDLGLAGAGDYRLPTLGELMQVVLHTDRLPDIPPEALDVHTRSGQESGRTMEDWFVDANVLEVERTTEELRVGNS